MRTKLHYNDIITIESPTCCAHTSASRTFADRAKHGASETEIAKPLRHSISVERRDGRDVGSEGCRQRQKFGGVHMVFTCFKLQNLENKFKKHGLNTWVSGGLYLTYSNYLILIIPLFQVENVGWSKIGHDLRTCC